MSKKVISAMLSAAMLVSSFCVGFGAIKASADETVTYYFLAPDSYCNTDKGAANSDVGFYYWTPSENAAWPGEKATPAPEIGYNVFKVECADMDSTNTIVFNAYVDAGTPVDPVLAKVAHQTVDINVEGYEEDESDLYPEGIEDFYGMIYVLYDDDAHREVNKLSEAVTTKGEWYSLDPSDSNYYKNGDAYKTYNFDDEADVATDETTDSEPEVTTKYHEGDTVTVDLQLHDIDAVSAINATVNYDPAVLEPVSVTETGSETAMILANNTSEGVINVGGMNAYGNDKYKGEAATVISLPFNVIADTDDLGISYTVTSLSQIIDGKNTKIIGIGLDTEDIWSNIAVSVDCPHGTATNDTPAQVDTDTSSSTDTAVDSEKSTDTSSTNTDTNSKSSDSEKDSDSKETNDKANSDSSKNNSSSSSGSSNSSSSSNGSAIQTAGTFAVVSLIVILMSAAAVVLYTRKKTEE